MRPAQSARRSLAALAVVGVGLLAGCDRLGGALGLESPEQVAALREAEGKAIGGACRHAGRAIEDCYALNRKADKASVFAGWREMNDYMRENKIQEVAAQLAPNPLAAAKSAAPADEDAADGAVRAKAEVARPKSREKPPAS